MKSLDFVFYYTRLVDIEAAFLLEEETEGTFFSRRKIYSQLALKYHHCQGVSSSLKVEYGQGHLLGVLDELGRKLRVQSQGGGWPYCLGGDSAVTLATARRSKI